MQIYKRIRDLREDSDKKQAEIAKVLNTTQSYYGQYERGVREIPTKHIITLAKFYNVSADYILCLTDDKTIYYK